ncbi:MAG TPA: lasso peptide biosynthesis B2 protein [Candidatus Megaira endosymbiont of Nemacystus decipiens]|nr:lasso peptide biosynthesis B2 protein [Candidatus Megaera endosymbiont of Nemacystus decipiens]
MYFQVSDNIRLVSFRNTIILLDLVKNDYLVLPDDSSSQLRLILNSEMGFSHSEGTYVCSDIEVDCPDQISELLELFLKNGYLVKTNSPPSDLIDLSPNNKTGAKNIDWKIHFDDLEYRCSAVDFVLAYLELIKVCFVSYFCTFKRLVNITNLDSCEKPVCCAPDKQSENELANALNIACLYFPFRIKCLEWAVTYVRLSHKRMWRCSLQIGVQNMPFMAHAWAKTANGVVLDDQKLTESLAIIVNEPFTDKEL